MEGQFARQSSAGPSAEILRFAIADELRQGDRQDEAAAIEEVLHEGLDAEDGEAGYPGDQEIDRHERAPGIEPAGRDAGRAEEGGGKGRQQEGQAGERVGGADRPRVKDPGAGAEEAGDEEAVEARPVDLDPGKAGDLAAAADEQKAPAGRRILEE